MNWFPIILTIFGLSLFEIINSMDNAIINAEVLATMSKKARKWFLFVGILTAVFIVRGLLPWLIIWGSSPKLGPLEAFISSFSANESIASTIEESAPVLLLGAGVFLIFLFLHWVFLEEKNALFTIVKQIQDKRLLFYTIAFFFMTSVLLLAQKKSLSMAIAALIGFFVFLVTQFVKRRSEIHVMKIKRDGFSDMAKIVYLELIDASFSIDGVLGAFAFTFVVPFILIGNGIGALVVRQLTLKNANSIQKYKFIKNGAMYSICVLGILMLLESLDTPIPDWISPITTIVIVGFFFWKSTEDIKKQNIFKV